MVSDTNNTKIAEGYVPKNTSKSTVWANKNFDEWRDERNKVFSDEQCPVDLLENRTHDKNYPSGYQGLL